jgi:geranylgeranyl diphosphate synthase, type I
VTAPSRRDLPPACLELADRVDAELARFLMEQRKAVAGDDPHAATIFDELDRVISSGGKRLRPLFCCLGYRAAGEGVDERTIRAGAALELLHTFAIVHDDVMDRSGTRRGEPASWVHLADRHRGEGMLGDPEQWGVSGAVLVGDLALVLAGRALHEAGFPPDRLGPALERYDRMRAEVVVGQYLDVLAAHRGEVDEDEARRIAVLKSGGYTVEAPLHIGALLAGGPPELLAALSAYGVPLGEAFQLRDDVLGVFGDPSVTGKDRDSDLREGKRTVLVSRAAAAAPPEDGEFLRTRLGRPDLTDREVERARAILEDSGARASVVDLIEALVGAARAALRTDAIDPEAAALLEDLSGLVAARNI